MTPDEAYRQEAIRRRTYEQSVASLNPTEIALLQTLQLLPVSDVLENAQAAVTEAGGTPPGIAAASNVWRVYASGLSVDQERQLLTTVGL